MPELDPTKLAAIDEDVAELLEQLDVRDDELGAGLDAEAERIDALTARVAVLEEGGTTEPPPPVVPPTPLATDVHIVVTGREALISVTSPTATMARFDVDPGPTLEEPGLSHVRAGLEPGSYFAQVAVGNAAGWSEQSPQVPFTIATDVPPDPPPYTDRVTPMIYQGAVPLLRYRFHDLAPNTTALQLLGSGWEAGELLLERVCQGIFWADAGWLHDVDVWNFGRGGAGTSGQAHGVYGRGGVVERVRVHTIDPTAPHGSSAFHAHREDGPVTGLTWRDCANYSGAESIMAGYRAGMTDNVIDGFEQPAGKLRVGVRDEDAGENHFDRLDVALLQVDGDSWSAGTRFSGRARQVVHAGGLPMTLEQLADLYPTVDWSGLTIG